MKPIKAILASVAATALLTTGLSASEETNETKIKTVEPTSFGKSFEEGAKPSLFGDCRLEHVNTLLGPKSVMKDPNCFPTPK